MEECKIDKDVWQEVKMPSCKQSSSCQKMCGLTVATPVTRTLLLEQEGGEAAVHAQADAGEPTQFVGLLGNWDLQGRPHEERD